MGRWIVIGLLAIAVVVGLGAWFGDGDWGDRDGWRDSNAQAVTTAEGETIVIERDRHFFPFFIFIPFLIFGLFWAFGPWRGRGGDWRRNGPDALSEVEWDRRMTEWHRREHEQSNADR